MHSSYSRRKYSHLRVGGSFEDLSAGVARFYGKVAPAFSWIRDELVKPLVSLLLESGLPQKVLKKELGNITGAVLSKLPSSPAFDQVKEKAVKLVDANKDKIIDGVVKKYIMTQDPKKKRGAGVKKTKGLLTPKEIQKVISGSGFETDNIA